MARKQRPSGVSVERLWWEAWLLSPNEYDREIAQDALKALRSKKKKGKRNERED